jgi:L-ascorbate metabolism protein UlaG (beta-lactamase superfamily)
MPQFSNRSRLSPRGLRTLLKWRLGLGESDFHAERPHWNEIPVAPNPKEAIAALGDREHATWFGHSSVFLRIGGLKILIDPIEGDLPLLKRRVPAMPIHEIVPHPDVIMITHNHYDHMDEKTLMHFLPGTLFLIPKGMASWFIRRGRKNYFEMDWWENCVVNKMKITYVPSQHWSKRALFDTNDSLWGGYVLEYEGKRVYHAGDSGYFEGFTEIRERLGPIDLAFLPIGAYSPSWFMRPAHMDPWEAVQAANDLEAREVIPIHYGTFRLSSEPLTEPPAVLEQVAEECDYAGVRLLPVGGSLVMDLVKDQGR